MGPQVAHEMPSGQKSRMGAARVVAVEPDLVGARIIVRHDIQRGARIVPKHALKSCQIIEHASHYQRYILKNLYCFQQEKFGRTEI